MSELFNIFKSHSKSIVQRSPFSRSRSTNTITFTHLLLLFVIVICYCYLLFVICYCYLLFLLLGTTEDNVVRRTKDGIHGSSLVHH